MISRVNERLAGRTRAQLHVVTHPYIQKMQIWQLQLLSVIGLVALAHIIEKKAAMRGCYRNPLSRQSSSDSHFVS